MDDTQKLLEMIDDLREHFDINNVSDYKMFINILYNNLMILEEADERVNNAIAALLKRIYDLNDPCGTHYFSWKEKLYSHILQGWMHIND